MTYLGEHINRKVYWWNYGQDNHEEWPDKDWICFAIADVPVTVDAFDKFARHAIKKGIAELIAYGKCSEQIHDLFDEIAVEMEVMEQHAEVDVMTTWHEEGIASAFWQCFYVTCLPDTADLKNLKIICLDFNSKDQKEKLKDFLIKFNEGWIPSDEE
jgi:hypothetical protein